MAFLQLSLDTHTDKRRHSYTVNQSRGYYIITDTSSQTTVGKLRMRSDYPSTFCVLEPSGAVFCGYGQPKPTDEQTDFLHIHIAPSGRFSIQRDLLSTLPLFYSHEDHILSVSNEYSVVWSNLSKHTLNEATLPEWLIPDINWRRHTACKEIHTLNELESLLFEQAHLKVQPGLARPWGISSDAPSTRPQDFMSTLERHADTVLQRFLPSMDRAVFEISGGLDSSFLPLYASQKYPGIVSHASSILFNGYFRETHLEKLVAIGQYIHPQWSFVSFDDPDYRPLRDAVSEHTFVPGHYCAPGFEELGDKYAALLASKGYRIIFTGDGGDELFDNMTNVEESLGLGMPGYQRRYTTALPPFLTETFRAAWSNGALHASYIGNPQLAVNLHRAVILRNFFIRHDIWPVTPFANKELYYFCQGLPIHFRANKNVFRAYYQAKGWPPCIYNPRADEHPGNILDDIYLSGYYSELINYFCTHGLLTNYFHYIDKDSLLTTLWSCIQNKTQGEARTKSFFATHFWLLAEIGLSCFRNS